MHTHIANSRQYQRKGQTWEQDQQAGDEGATKQPYTAIMHTTIYGHPSPVWSTRSVVKFGVGGCHTHIAGATVVTRANSSGQNLGQPIQPHASLFMQTTGSKPIINGMQELAAYCQPMEKQLCKLVPPASRESNQMFRHGNHAHDHMRSPLPCLVNMSCCNIRGGRVPHACSRCYCCDQGQQQWAELRGQQLGNTQ